LQKDFLKFEPKELALATFKLCGNLPFNITSPVIDWIVNYRSKIQRAVIMMQKEVALRLASKPNSKDWSPLAIFTQLHFNIQILFNVGPQHFIPSPKVTSAVVELIPKVSQEIRNYSEFERLVRASFRQRRKQLINNLVPFLIPTVPAAEKILGQLGLKRKVRAEEVSTEQFLELTELLAECNMFGTNLTQRK
jgi:16S rRNA (adenine1518-N6/adenine1519-N6)-dimethyltransferase